MQDSTLQQYELSIVMPCLNEAETIGTCVDKAMKFLTDNSINGEIVVADNGSSDGSDSIALEHGARVFYVAERGYGSALIGGINAALGKYVIMGDSDDSHDLVNLKPFIENLRLGYDLVVGNRFMGGVDKNAMPFLNRYIGNPILSGIGRVFFKSKIRDFHCGLRGFTKEAYYKMNLRTTGMEFASEMIVKATLLGMKMIEVPTKVAPPGRSGRPHLRAFSDGWRHLRFLLLYSPRWLFLYPGLMLIVLGMFTSIWLLPGSKLSLDIHTMLYAAAAIIIGFQGVSFAILTKTFAVQEQLLPEHERLKRLMRYATLEKGLAIGFIVTVAGLGGIFYTLYLLQKGEFSGLGITNTMRLVIASTTLMILGFQVIFSSFFYSILKLKMLK